MAFSGDEFLTWGSDPSCSAAENAPADCLEHGQFAVDAAAATLTLTSDAGRVTVRHFKVLGGGDNEAASDGAKPASLTTSSPSLVAAPSTLVGQNVSSFSLAPAGANVGESQVALTTFEKIGLVCRAVGLVVSPLPAPAIVPQINPPAIVEQQQCSKG
jgi:hypothetical protein